MTIDYFKLALEFTCYTDRSLFITGKAGTGKTTFLNSIRESCLKKYIVLAPTGVAAVNANAVTIHSFFQFPSDILDKTFFEKSFPAYNSSKRELIKELELIIIDEISMVRADVIDGIDKVLRYCRNKEDIPFGGVQLVFIGDLFQLSPIVSETDVIRMKELYSSPFFFDSIAIKKLDYVTIEFTSVFRQGDEAFVALLNRVRINSCTEEDIQILNRRHNSLINNYDSYVFLTTHRVTAENVNRNALTQIKSPLVTIPAIIEGEFPEKNDPCPRQMNIKIGARVIFTRNDSTDNRRFYNGKSGIIEKIENDVIVIRSNNNEKIFLERSTWINRGLKFNASTSSIEETELGSFSQFPIRLAWGITIHKSQGMTFERAVIDAKNSFAPGQVYVALSRIKSLDGLILQTPLTKESIQTDPRVISFYNKSRASNDLQKEIANSKRSYRHLLLISFFHFEKLINRFQLFSEKHSQVAFLEAFKEVFEEITNVSGRFCARLAELLNDANQKSYALVQERTTKAVSYFVNILETKLIKPLKEYSLLVESNKKNEPLIEDLNELFNVFLFKMGELKLCERFVLDLTDAINTQELQKLILEETSNFKVQLLETKKKEQKENNRTTQMTTLSLFKKGLTVDEIAHKRKLNKGIIEDHLRTFIKTGEIKLEDLITEQKSKVIMNLIRQQPEWSVHELRLALGTEYSFGEIRAVLETL